MDSSAHAMVADAPAAARMAGAAVALLDAKGTVVGWTQAAQRLVGHASADVVGRSAAFLLADGEDRAKASAFSQQSGASSGWSGFTTIRHRDGGSIDVRLWVQSLSGKDGRARWVVSAAEAAALSSWATGGSGVVSLPGATHLPSHPPVGVVIRDTDLLCTWANDAQGARDRITLEQRLGRTPTQAAPGRQAETLEALMRQVLDSGVPTVNVEFRTFAPAHVRQESTLLASFFRLDDAQGRALGVCVVIADVTDTRRARERLALLGEAGKRIGNTLDVMRTAQELADLAVPLLADYATVDLLESVSLGEEPPVRLGSQGGAVPAFHRAGLASIHAGTPEALFARGEPVLVPPASPVAGVLRSGKSSFVLDSSLDTWLGRHDAARAERARDHGMHSLMIVPIRARGAVLGVAVFVRTDARVPFDQDDLLLAEELVGWAALSMDNARRYARERSAALALQRHLLPHHPTGGSAADVAWRYLPADSHHGVGGDWFDVIPLSGARIGLVVGDVAGHGIKAAATMGQLRAAVRTLADMDLPPDELLSRLDDQVIRLAEADADPFDPAAATIAATCLYAVYDPVTRRCTIARAGHPPPAVIDPHGEVTFPDLPTGAPLGVGLVPFESVTLELSEGSVLALYTDGLIEARDHDIDAGMNHLADALAGSSGLSLDELTSSAVERLSTHGDDITLLLARTRALGPDQVASWEFPADPSLVSSARALARARLKEWGLEHLIASTELIVSELVTNAVRHASGPIRLRLIRHRTLTCEVHDTSVTSPRLRRALATDESGRGLLLVDQLARRWGTRHTPAGKLTWAEQDLGL